MFLIKKSKPEKLLHSKIFINNTAIINLKMVSLAVTKKLEEHYKNNLERYVKEHSEEYLLLEDWPDIKESFYKTRSELETYKSNKYGIRIGYTILIEKIPKEMP